MRQTNKFSRPWCEILFVQNSPRDQNLKRAINLGACVSSSVGFETIEFPEDTIAFSQGCQKKIEKEISRNFNKVQKFSDFNARPDNVKQSEFEVISLARPTRRSIASSGLLLGVCTTIGNISQTIHNILKENFEKYLLPEIGIFHREEAFFHSNFKEKLD